MLRRPPEIDYDLRSLLPLVEDSGAVLQCVGEYVRRASKVMQVFWIHHYPGVAEGLHWRSLIFVLEVRQVVLRVVSHPECV